ncbi:hypothetical protein ACCC88_02605 [Sphingomonas sp. Sphisp140]|uniref:hypothetical protein n=1 Tax=unclassified Sphingomonas TaxID=196159 RepID=UPI0039AF107C
MSEVRFVARISRRKVIGNVLFQLAGAGLMLAFLISHSPVSTSDWLALLLLAGGTLMFLYGAFRIGSVMSYRGELLSIDAEGIQMPRCYRGVLPWSSIARAAVVKGRLQLWLVKDAAIPPGKGLDHILRTNQALRREEGGADLGVGTWLADRRNGELIDAVRAQAPQLFV